MDWHILAVYVAACVAAGAGGSLFTPGDWWKTLRKPWFTPPDWFFPVGWTTIYALSAVAATRIAAETGSGLAPALWALQIALNTLWSPVFFGLHRMRVSLVIGVALWLTVFTSIFVFWPIDAIAGALMIPYAVYMALAVSLNVGTLMLNPDQDAGRAQSPAE